MAPSIKGQLLALAVSEYHSNTGSDAYWGGLCRDAARDIRKALRDDLEKRPEHRQLSIELGFQPQDGGTGGKKRKRRPSQEEDQVTSDIREPVWDPPASISTDLPPSLKRQTTLSRELSNILQVTAPVSGLTGATPPTPHTPQSGRLTGPLQHVTQGAPGHSAATLPGQNVMTSQPSLSLQPQLMSQPSQTSHARIPQPPLTVLQPSQFPSFPVPSGSASQSSLPQTSTLHSPQSALFSQPSPSRTSLRSPPTPPGSVQHTLDSSNPLHYPASTTQQIPVSISQSTPTCPGRQLVPDSLFPGRVWAPPPLYSDNDLPWVDSAGSGVDLSSSGQTGTAKDNGQRGQTSYTAAMEEEYSVCTDRQRRPEDRNRELEDRLRHYEDEQRSLQDRNRELEERMRQYAADERRLQDRGRELEEEQRSDKEAIRQLQERNRQLQEEQGRDKVTISNLHNGQSILQTKVKQLEDKLNNYDNERAREDEVKLLKYREKVRKLEQKRKAVGGQLGEGAEVSQTVQPGPEGVNEQMDDFTEHRTLSAPDLGKGNRQRTRENKQLAKQARHSKGDHSERGYENAALEGESSGHPNIAPDLGQKHRRSNDKNRQSTQHAPDAKGDDSTSDVLDSMAGPSCMDEEASVHAPQENTCTRSPSRKHGMVQLTSGRDVYVSESQFQSALDNSKRSGVTSTRQRDVTSTRQRDVTSTRPRDVTSGPQYDGSKLARKLLRSCFSVEERKCGSLSEQPRARYRCLNPATVQAIVECCLKYDPTSSEKTLRAVMASALTSLRNKSGKKNT